MPQQQPPQPGREVVWPEFMKRLEERADLRPTANAKVMPVLRELVQVRVKEGFEKYGTYLMTRNGRNAVKDSWDECIDGCMYLTQADMEGHRVNYLLQREFETLLTLTGMTQGTERK